MKCTVIIPTLDHQDTLNYSIPSVLAQTHQDFELIVIGDGAPHRTDDIMQQWCERDERISYIPRPKGAGHGELYRHEAILSSSGDYIFYLSDDDLWYPNHLTVLMEYLKVFDFVHSVHTAVFPDDRITHLINQLADRRICNRMTQEKWNFFGPTVVAHTRSAYLKLPVGWNPRPDGMWSDLHMWRQWLSQPWVRFFSIPMVTSLHFPSPFRKEMDLNQRTAELELYSRKMNEDSFLESIRGNFELQQNGQIDNSDELKVLVEKLRTSNEQIRKSKQKLKGRYDKLRKAPGTRIGHILYWPFKQISRLF